MVNYEIKHYQEGFEVEQARIGTEVAKTYALPHQTQADNLKEIYSREGFDPETRLYAFKGDKMVGFLTSNILGEQEDGVKRANLTPPQVLSEYKDEVSELLFNKALKILKSKGAQQIRSQFGCRQSHDESQAKKWGFNQTPQNTFVYKIDLSIVDSNIPTDNVVDMDLENELHFEEGAKALASLVEQEVDWAKGIFNRWKERPNENRKPFVIVDDGKIKAYMCIFSNNVFTEYAVLFGIWADSEDYMKQLLAKLKTITDEKQIKQVTVSFTETTDIELEKYKSIKFDFVGTHAFFVKDL